jgi:acyl-coenzyme A thioesterase PaaI-like protein
MTHSPGQASDHGGPAGSGALRRWQTLSGTAFGRWLFSRMVAVKAPYFASIRAVFDVLEPGRAVARMRKRRAVTNHIGTVHAIAMANLCELVAGTVTEVSVPRSMRWIPRGMQIDYLAKAETDLTGEATLPPVKDRGARHDHHVPVTARNAKKLNRR